VLGKSGNVPEFVLNSDATPTVSMDIRQTSMDAPHAPAMFHHAETPTQHATESLAMIDVIHTLNLEDAAPTAATLVMACFVPTSDVLQIMCIEYLKASAVEDVSQNSTAVESIVRIQSMSHVQRAPEGSDEDAVLCARERWSVIELSIAQLLIVQPTQREL
jgi:hypothetical protein